MYNTGTDKLLQVLTLRGIDEKRLKPPISKAGTHKDVPAYKCESVTEMINFYLSCTTYATATNTTVVSRQIPVNTPFPNIFDQRVGVNGSIIAKDRPKHLCKYSTYLFVNLRLFSS